MSNAYTVYNTRLSYQEIVQAILLADTYILKYVIIYLGRAWASNFMISLTRIIIGLIVVNCS